MTIIPVGTVIKEKSGTKARTGKTSEMATATAITILMTGTALLLTTIMRRVFKVATVPPVWQKNITVVCRRDRRRDGERVIRYRARSFFMTCPAFCCSNWATPAQATVTFELELTYF